MQSRRGPQSDGTQLTAQLPNRQAKPAIECILAGKEDEAGLSFDSQVNAIYQVMAMPRSGTKLAIPNPVG
jgi:hypothetical protein